MNLILELITVQNQFRQDDYLINPKIFILSREEGFFPKDSPSPKSSASLTSTKIGRGP